MTKYVFFTNNDFKKDGGATIRMRGIVNALAEADQKVVLISNAKLHKGFNSSIKHISAGIKISKRDKRLFQAVLILLPNFITKLFFRNYLLIFRSIFEKEKINDNCIIIFFEYLDNSIGLFLNKHRVINRYLNDTHGNARLEFLHKSSDRTSDKVLNLSKYLLAKVLDKQHYKNSAGTIFLSNSMQEYFEKYYTFLSLKNNFVVRDGINSDFYRQIINKVDVQKYRDLFNITAEDNVVFFAGNFKDSGGVLDLIKAINLVILKGNIPNIKLLLIGEGECFNEALNFCKKKHLQDKVFFVGRVPYADLRSYQELADIIVCPDKKHPLSELVPHIKYFDALVSGKTVINGSFASIKDINHDERFSINFEPSDVNDLCNKIEKVLLNKYEYRVRSKTEQDIIFSEFSYQNTTKVLMDDKFFKDVRK